MTKLLFTCALACTVALAAHPDLHAGERQLKHVSIDGYAATGNVGDVFNSQGTVETIWCRMTGSNTGNADGGPWTLGFCFSSMIVRDTTARENEPVPAHRAASSPHSAPSPQSARHVPMLRAPAVAPQAKPVDDAFLETAMTTLERDLADGRWGIADRDRLNQALRRANREQTTQLLAVLFPQLNAGTIKSDIDGPPI